LVAGDEIRLLDKVGRANRVGSESQVRHRDRTRLARVVDEVTLRVEVGELANQLDAGLVGADRAVAAQAEEDGLNCPARDMESSVRRDAGAGDVVEDADRQSMA